MASDEKIIQMGEPQETPQAITITIMDPSALGDASINSSLVASVEAQNDGSDPSTIVMVPGEEHSSKDILQTVTETHMGTEELPIISSISNPEEEGLAPESKVSDTFEGEGAEGEGDELVGQHCLICNLDLPPCGTNDQIPVFKTQTSTTHRRLAVFLSNLIGQKLTSRKAHSDIMCQRCFNLLDRVDSLEVEIKETKEEIVNKYQETVSIYGGRARRRKPATAKKTDYVFPKVEPEDETDQLMGMEIDGNFEPRMEDLMEEEHDRQEDRNAQDEEWEPEFKRPRIKREATDIDSGVPPKRKRGRPRKDATRPKVASRQRDGELASQPSASTRRIITVPSTFRKCPHCPTIFLDNTQLTHHLAQQHRDHQQERQCLRCRKHYLTYEDHTACDPCLQTMRQNAVPSREHTEAGAAPADTRSPLLATAQCGHCHQSFQSRVLAELHCLSTGHNMEQITSTKPKENQQCSAGEEAVTDTSLEAPDTAARKRVKAGSKTRRGRKRRLIRKNQTVCEMCGEECGSVSSLYVHLRSSHPAMFPHQCGVCGRRFSLEANAREHERRHALGELQCPACPLRFSRMSHLHHHARHHHPDFTSFPCQYCGAVTPTVDALHSHIKVHHGDRLGLPAAFTCEICQETFHTGKALACHRFSRHPGMAECNICGAQVGSRYLSKHINAVHTKEKIHKCDQCGKDFYSRTSLTGHQKRQHGPRKHLCHLCGKGYVHNVELQRHLKAHRNQRDFKCDFCGRSFLKAVDLTYHRRSHTGERPHQCRLCPEAFIKPLGLRKHMLKHTTVKKGKRLKYSKKKIDELASSVVDQDEDEGEGESGAGRAAEEPDAASRVRPPQEDLPNAQSLTQPIQVFPDAAVGASPQPQSRLQQLPPAELQVQQLAVTDMNGGQLEGQLELSQVVENLSSGELLEMGPGLLLETADVRGGHHDGVSGGEAEGGEERETSEGEARRPPPQPVQVIYVHFMDPSL